MEPVAKRTRKSLRLLLFVPYVALLFPALFARATPALFGFPFFYWYQLAWVLVTGVLLGTYYKLTKV